MTLQQNASAASEQAASSGGESAPRPVAAGKKSTHEVDKLFEALVKLDGSDLHLKVGQPPYIRFKGALTPLKSAPLTKENN